MKWAGKISQKKTKKLRYSNIADKMKSITQSDKHSFIHSTYIENRQWTKQKKTNIIH